MNQAGRWRSIRRGGVPTETRNDHRYLREFVHLGLRGRDRAEIGQTVVAGDIRWAWLIGNLGVGRRRRRQH